MMEFKGVSMNYRGKEYYFDVTYVKIGSLDDNSRDRIKIKSIDRVYRGDNEVYDTELIAEMNKNESLRRRIGKYLDRFFEGDDDFIND